MDKRSDVAQKAIDSIGKPKVRDALEAEKKLAKMSPEELELRLKMKKHYKIRPNDIQSGGGEK